MNKAQDFSDPPALRGFGLLPFCETDHVEFGLTVEDDWTPANSCKFTKTSTLVN